MKPLFKHDCDECLFLGTIPDADKQKGWVDIWVHERSPRSRRGNKVYIEYIRRFSDEPSDYGCMSEERGFKEGIYKFNPTYRQIIDMYEEYKANEEVGSREKDVSSDKG